MPCSNGNDIAKWKHDDQIVFALDSSDDGAWSPKEARRGKFGSSVAN